MQQPVSAFLLERQAIMARSTMVAEAALAEELAFRAEFSRDFPFFGLLRGVEVYSREQACALRTRCGQPQRHPGQAT